MLLRTFRNASGGKYEEVDIPDRRQETFKTLGQVGNHERLGAFWKERLNGGIAHAIDKQLALAWKEKHNVKIYAEVK